MMGKNIKTELSIQLMSGSLLAYEVQMQDMELQPL